MENNKKTQFVTKKYMYLVIILLYVILFSVFAYKTIGHIMDSDIASEMLLGQEQSDRSQWVLSPDVYYNTEIRLFDIQFLTAPILKILHNWNLATIIANAIYMLLFSVSIFYFTSLLGENPNYELSLGAAIFVCLPYSYNFYYIGLGCGYYISKLMIEALILWCFTLVLKGRDNKKAIIPICWLCVFAYIAGLKSIRYMLVIFIPLFLACIIVWWEKFYKQKIADLVIADFLNCNEFKAFMIIVLSIVINGLGYVCNSKILAKKYHYSNYSIINFGDISAENNIFKRIARLIYGWLEVMGFSNNVGVFSLRGITNVLIFAVVIFTIYAIVYLFREYIKFSMVEKIMFLFALLSVLFNSYVFCMTDEFVPRYYVPVYFVVVIIYYMFWTRKVNNWGELSIKWLSVGLMTIYLLLSSFNTISYANGLNTVDDKKEVLAFLEENDYNFGYATYWNAAVLTGMTNGKIEMANILNVDTMEGYLWNTCAKYYAYDYAKGKTFILLRKEEYEEHKDSAVIKGGTLVYNDDIYYVYSYINSQTIYQLVQ